MPTCDQFVSTLSEWNEVYMHNSMRNLFHYSKENRLSMSQIGALFRVFHMGNGPVSGISEELGISGAAASQMLERLVKQGLIFRSENPIDRRMKRIVLTDKGRQVLQESIAARQGWFVDLANSLSEDEKSLVVMALNILIEKANLLEINPN
jgi:DNA-binding MarR family transcriptional regulator